ncbi:hypothetical protein NL530_27665, partial [Klebsiella pneumoniae]|nr:hypothetical protein [Klebsiella pneumoniae]
GVRQFRLFYKGTTGKASAQWAGRIDLGEAGGDIVLRLPSLPVVDEASWRGTGGRVVLWSGRW